MCARANGALCDHIEWYKRYAGMRGLLLRNVSIDFILGKRMSSRRHLVYIEVLPMKN